MPWAQGGTLLFSKPRYEQIHALKLVPKEDRLPMFSEFYELQEYLDLAANLPPGRMLDAGAGSGSLSYLFAHMGWDVTSCDHDKSAFLYRDGKFMSVDLNKDWPFDSGFFNLIVCKQVIEHLENPNHWFRQVSRLSKRGGMVILSTPNIASLAGRLAFLRSGQLAYFESYWADHRTILHYGQLKSMFEECLFQDVRFHTNRYELYNMNADVNGKRMRFLSPVLKMIASRKTPEACRYGQFIIVSATRS